MMIKAKKWLCLMLSAATLLLCACGNKGKTPGPNSGPIGGDKGSGRWLETDITPKDFEAGLRCFSLPGGKLVAYTEGLKQKWESADNGKSWTKTDGPGAADSRYNGANSVALLEDGSLIVALTGEDGMSVKGLEKISPEQGAKPFPVEALDKAVAEGKLVSIMQLEGLPKNRLLLNFGGIANIAMSGGNGEGGMVSESGAGSTGGASVENAQTAPPSADVAASEGDESEPGPFNFGDANNYFDQTLLLDTETGGVVYDFKDGGAISLASDGEKLYLLGYDGKLAAYTLADGKQDTGFTGSFGNGGEGAFNQKLAAGSNDSMVMCNGKKVMSLSADGKVQELMDGSAYSFGSPTSYISSFSTTLDGGLLMGVNQQNGGLRIYHYSYDANAKLDPSKLVKVWSLNDNFNARAAISTFRKQNPEVTVDYEVALAGESALTAEDAIKNLNTRLLNGDGPDVMILDGCPVESYVAKGVLADLAPLLDTGDVYPLVLDAFTQAGKVYALPMELSVPMLIGQQAQLKALASLDDVLRAVTEGRDRPANNYADSFAAIPEEDRPAFDFSELREVYDLLWNASSGAVVKNNAVDGAALGKLLTALKAINDKYKLSSGEAVMGRVAITSAGNASVSLGGSPIAYSVQRALYGAFMAHDLQLMQMVSDVPGSGNVVFPGLSAGAWVPGCLAGINTDSPVPKLAAGLLQAMLSEEAQATIMSGGLPVTKKGAAAEIAAIDTQMRENSAEAAAPKGFAIDYDSLINQLKEPVLNDDTLTNTLWGITQKLCQGELDVEGAVKQFEQESKNYLAERKQ